MPYTPQSWSDSPATTTPITAARLGVMETGIQGAFARADDAYALAAAIGAGGGTGSPFVTVAASNAPAAVKSLADYVCANGSVDNQVELNAAITDAYNASGGGRGWVLPIGLFTINGSIFGKTGCQLHGVGRGGSFIRASGMGAVGMIQLENESTHAWTVSNLTIFGNYASGGSSHGFAYRNSTGALGAAAGTDGDMTGVPSTDPDAVNTIENVYVYGFGNGTARSGMWLDDNARETHVAHVRAFDCGESGFKMTGASDCKFLLCTAIKCGTGYSVGGGNNILAACKSSFSDVDGFSVTSSRADLNGCTAQDDGRWGFSITGGSPTLDGCIADSNQRLDSTGGGFLLNAEGKYSDLHAYDRNQTPASRQTRGISLGASIGQSWITGLVNIPSGTNWVVGTTPSANSYARVIRNGTTLYSVG
jgi:Right handed beta helix region